MVTGSAFNSAGMPQRAIYDERYLVGLYDRRSKVPVLTAERDALNAMVARTVRANPHARQISIFDFGYGTGRVINDWVREYAYAQLSHCDELRIVAYDAMPLSLSLPGLLPAVLEG